MKIKAVGYCVLLNVLRVVLVSVITARMTSFRICAMGSDHDRDLCLRIERRKLSWGHRLPLSFCQVILYPVVERDCITEMPV